MCNLFFCFLFLILNKMENGFTFVKAKTSPFCASFPWTEKAFFFG